MVGRNRSLSLVFDPEPGLGSPDPQSRVIPLCEVRGPLPSSRFRQEKEEKSLNECRSHSVWREWGKVFAPEAERSRDHKMGEPGAV